MAVSESHNSASHELEGSDLASSTQQFLDYLRDVRQLSPHTLTNYQRDLKSLLAFCKEQKIFIPAKITESEIRQWAAQMHRRGLAGSSIQRSLSACRSYFNYLGRMHNQRHNPATAVQAPRQSRRLPKTLDADQVGQYLTFDSDSITALRDHAITELFYSSGLRLAEQYWYL